MRAGLLAVALLWAPPGRGAEDPAQSLDEFELFQYVSIGRHAPEPVIALDSNSLILFACRDGRSLEELRADGIEYVDSQIELLIAMNLLFRDGVGDLYTRFPVLDSDDLRPLRAEIAVLAEALDVAVRPELEVLLEELASRGWIEHGYSMTFSYVLDGMVWGFLEEYRRVAPRRLSLREPFWSGQIWALRPGRPAAAGTLALSNDGLSLKLTTPLNREGPGGAALNSLASDAKTVRRALGESDAAGGVPEGVARERLAALELVDERGMWRIPVVDELGKGPIFRAAESLTEKLVDTLLEAIDLEALQDRYRFRNAQEALVIAYHELMWELMERFGKSGAIVTPGAFEAASEDSTPDLRALAFLVNRRAPKSELRDRMDTPEPRFDQPPPDEEDQARP